MLQFVPKVRIKHQFTEVMLRGGGKMIGGDKRGEVEGVLRGGSKRGRGKRKGKKGVYEGEKE